MFCILFWLLNSIKSNIYTRFGHKQPAQNAQNDVFFLWSVSWKTTSDLGRFLQALVRGWLTWCSTRQVAFKWWIVKEQTFLRQRWTKLFETRLFSNSANIFLASGLCTSRNSKKKPFPNLKSFDTAKHQEISFPRRYFWTPESFGNASLGCTNLQSSYSIEPTYGLIEVRKTGHKSGQNPWEFWWIFLFFAIDEYKEQLEYWMLVMGKGTCFFLGQWQ